MGKDLYDNSSMARELFELANDIIGFRITDIMFGGTAEELKRTDVTQPAVFLHSVILAKVLDIKPDGVAGHSLGEFSALVAAEALSFEDGLRLVAKRAAAMQKACESNPGTMAAVLGLEDSIIEQICEAENGVVVAANYNCPGQLVISGETEAVGRACETLKAAGARRALPLPVGGAFHSPLMESARQELEQAIAEAEFRTPRCPIYQNVDALPHTAVEVAVLRRYVREVETLVHGLSAPLHVGSRCKVSPVPSAVPVVFIYSLAAFYFGVGDELAAARFGAVYLLGSEFVCHPVGIAALLII